MAGRAQVTRRTAYLVAALAVCVTGAIVVYPEAAFQASVDGLRLWWEIVFPALLPFFVAAEALMALGVVHFLGVLLEPLMRPLFDVPGVGAFAFAMGLVGGYPIGARITANLRRKGLCNQIEGERLVSFSNTADPLFMAGAVAVGMFRLPSLGAVICAAHYVSAAIVGVLMRLHGGIQRSRDADRPRRDNILARALAELHRARQADGRPFGQVLGDSVRDSVNNMLLIAGFIMMFSVMIRVLTVAGATGAIAGCVGAAMRLVGVSPELAGAFVSGLLEITLGTELASKAAAPLIQRVMAANAVIAWSGLSVFAQVSAMCSGTDIRMAPYLVARIAQALIAAVLTLLLMSPVGQALAGSVIPAAVTGLAQHPVPFVTRLATSATALGRTLAIMASASIALWAARRLRVVVIRIKS